MENKNDTMKAIVKTTGEVVTTGTIGTVSATGMISAGASAVMLATGISEINQLPKKATIGSNGSNSNHCHSCEEARLL